MGERFSEEEALLATLSKEDQARYRALQAELNELWKNPFKREDLSKAGAVLDEKVAVRIEYDPEITKRINEIKAEMEALLPQKGLFYEGVPYDFESIQPKKSRENALELALDYINDETDPSKRHEAIRDFLLAIEGRFAPLKDGLMSLVARLNEVLKTDTALTLEDKTEIFRERAKLEREEPDYRLVNSLMEEFTDKIPVAGTDLESLANRAKELLKTIRLYGVMVRTKIGELKERKIL